MITCGCMLLGVPLIGSGFGSGDSYYEVTLAGKTVGSVKNPSVVENAYLQARAPDFQRDGRSGAGGCGVRA